MPSQDPQKEGNEGHQGSDLLSLDVQITGIQAGMTDVKVIMEGLAGIDVVFEVDLEANDS